MPEVVWIVRASAYGQGEFSAKGNADLLQRPGAVVVVVDEEGCEPCGLLPRLLE